MKLGKGSIRVIVAIIAVAFLAVAAPSLFKSKSAIAGCEPAEYLGQAQRREMAIYEEELVGGVPLVSDIQPADVLGVADIANRWIEVDLSEQRLYAWEGDKLFLTSLVSTGMPWWPTPPGEYDVWIKLRSTKMEGGTGRNYYYLPNVPFVMYLKNDQVPAWKGYGLHGTYWHSDFGIQKSHGCVNLPTEVAERLYNWIGPQVSGSRWVAYASPENPGTRVVIHE